MEHDSIIIIDTTNTIHDVISYIHEFGHYLDGLIVKRLKDELSFCSTFIEWTENIKSMNPYEIFKVLGCNMTEFVNLDIGSYDENENCFEYLKNSKK